MHFWFGVDKTLCGEKVSFSEDDNTFRTNRWTQVTGLDSKVTCNTCLDGLTVYRQSFPLAHQEKLTGGRR